MGQIFAQTDGGWEQLPGAAYDIAHSGICGSAWCIGTDSYGDGYGIFKFHDNDWKRMPGAGTRIAMSMDNPWVINSNNDIYRKDDDSENDNWIKVPGKALDISAGFERMTVFGSDQDPIVVGDDKRIYEWHNDDWRQISGLDGVIKVAARSHDMHLFAITENNEIWESSSTGGRWDKLTGLATDIASARGGVWITGTDLQPGGHGIFQLIGNRWVGIQGAAVAITVQDDANLLVINDYPACMK